VALHRERRPASEDCPDADEGECQRDRLDPVKHEKTPFEEGGCFVPLPEYSRKVPDRLLFS
jgi:hypothetical protein